MTDTLDVVFVDAFARAAGEGNRAAVIRLAEPRPEQLLAELARSLGQPVTVYLSSPSGGGTELRWFAPSGELRSCGHGTLAAAHLLLDEADGAQLSFETPLGSLRASRVGTDIQISMPLEPLQPWPLDEAVAGWLGAQVLDSQRSARHGLVRVSDHRVVEQLRPDLAALAGLPVVGLAVTAPGYPPYDLVSRWFVPRHGIEDQATGTAHCLLGGYWAGQLGRDRLLARQASSNGADLALTVGPHELLLAGGAVTVGRGRVAAAAPFAADLDTSLQAQR
ncbi:MAG: PhzF family phenazine biosynthesis protein [Jatrophihabitans sp.]